MNDGYKICGACGVSKLLSAFYKKLDGKSSKCKLCTKIDNDNYRSEHKEELYSYRRTYYQDNKQELISYGKEYRADIDNKKIISVYKKGYLKKNRKAIYERSNKRRKIRRKEDPIYRIRNLISRSVARILKNNGTSKKGGSIKNNLPFSIPEMKQYIETLFEPWMNWNNQGKYDPNTWDDNESMTWTWQIDHIIPQSDLPYSSMTDDNFKKCWSLDNLRPLSAKQNLLDGSKRTRHK